MPEPLAIASLKNTRGMEWRALNKSRGDRRSAGLFLAEGEHMAEEALNAGKARALLVLETLRARYSRLIGQADGQEIPVYLLSEPVLHALSDAKTPQGVIAVCSLPDEKSESAFDGDVLVALDDVQDPGNVGTILRTLDAAGFSGLILSKGCADPFSPKALRASMGAVFRVPVYLSDSLPDTLNALKMRGFGVMAGTLDGDPFYSRGTDDRRNCVVIGNEGAGISRDVLAGVTKKVMLPMRGGAESLNAAAACAVILYDMLRTRENRETKTTKTDE